MVRGRPWALAGGGRRPVFAAVFFGGGSGDHLAAHARHASPCSRRRRGRRGRVRRARAAAPGPRGQRRRRSRIGLVAWVGVSIVWSIAGDRSWSALAKGLVYLALPGPGLSCCGVAARRGGAQSRGGRARAGASALRSDGRCSAERFRASSRTAAASRGCASRSATGTPSRCSPDVGVPLGLWLVDRRSRRGAGGRPAGSSCTASCSRCCSPSRVPACSRSSLGVRDLALALPRRVSRVACSGCAAAVPAAARRALGVHAPGARRRRRPPRRPRRRRRAVRRARARWRRGIAVGARVAAPARAARRPRPATGCRARARRAAVGRVRLVALGGGGREPVSWAGDQVSSGECANDPSRLSRAVREQPAGLVGGRGRGLPRPSARRQRCADVRDRPQARAGGRDTRARAAQRAAAAALRPRRRRARARARLRGRCWRGGVRGALRAAGRAGAGGRGALTCLPVVYGGARPRGLRPRLHRGDRADAGCLSARCSGPARPRASRARRWLTAPRRWPGGASPSSWCSSRRRWPQRDVDRSPTSASTPATHRAPPTLRAGPGRSIRSRSIRSARRRGRRPRRRHRGSARALYLRATEMQPENAETWITLGLFELAARGDMCAAYQAFNRAYTLDPNGRQWVPAGRSTSPATRSTRAPASASVGLRRQVAPDTSRREGFLWRTLSAMRLGRMDTRGCG